LAIIEQAEQTSGFDQVRREVDLLADFIKQERQAP
jgi:hypothetical protein